MNEFWSYLWNALAMILVAGIVTSWLWIPTVLNMMARRHFLITMIEEGTAKAIVKYGEFFCILMSYKDHDLDDNWNIIDRPGANRTCVRMIDNWLPGGLRWVGLPSKYWVYHYNFQWTSLRQGKTTTAVASKEAVDDMFLYRSERMSHIILKDDTYVLNLESDEDKEMIPLTVRALLTLRIINPYKALFRAEQWLEAVTNVLKPLLRSYIGTHNFDQLTTRDETLQHEMDDILKTEMRNELGQPPISWGDYIADRWGVQIKGIGLVSITPGGKRGKAYEESAAANYQAIQEGKRIRQLASAEADRIKTIAVAEAERITKVTEAVTAGGENALTIRALEAIETAGENGNTVIVGGENPVQMLLGLKDKKGDKK